MFIKPVFILIGLQVFSDGMGTSEKWWKGHTSLACCPLQYTLIPHTESSLRVWLEAKSMQRWVISIWHGKRAYLFHMPLILNTEPHIRCQKCYTVVGLTAAPGTLESYQPLNWAWLAGSAH